jgi:uncharacterized membrane protein YdjX (TVP38/TMEM64 family)
MPGRPKLRCPVFHPLVRLRKALSLAELWPALRAGTAVVTLFAAGLWVARHYAAPIEAAVSDHAALGVVVFFVTSVVAVLMPVLSNLPLLPIAVLAWGPAPTAILLLAGWVVGAALSFTLARRARSRVLRAFPSVMRHARIDRLIDPSHRLGSLILLRMTFPVDVLSYALGLFSRETTVQQNTLSTVIGAAPFAIVFAWFPALSGPVQGAVFAVSLLVFVLYVAWVLRRGERVGD